MIIINILHPVIQLPNIDFTQSTFFFFPPTVKHSVKCNILPTLYVSNGYSLHKSHGQWFNLNCIHSSPPLVHYLILLKSCFPRTMFHTVSRGFLIFLSCEIIIDSYEIMRNKTEILSTLHSDSFIGNSHIQYHNQTIDIDTIHFHQHKASYVTLLLAHLSPSSYPYPKSVV